MDRFQKTELILISFVLVLSILFIIFASNQNMLSGSFLFNPSPGAMKAPSNFISEENILVYEDRIVIKIEKYTLSRYDSSNSMIPVLDKGTTGIGINPKSEEDIHIGDIITFKQGEDLIAHRVIEKGTDKNGYFFITKGDNNDIDDGKIRFSQIDSVLIALIY